MSRVGIIGCGNIAPTYARTLNELGWVQIAAFADGIEGRAESFAAKYGGAAMSVEQMLADATIDAVVNLTPPQAHAAVTRQILEAGKSAFSEKPLGIDFDEGVALVALAASKGLRLGCAPDTFLGAGLQAARSAIDRGLIGEPLAANAFFQGFGPEWWHPNPEFFYGPGAGPMFDMGPYYLTALTTLLGPAASISGAARIGMAERVVHAKGRVGDVIAPTVPTHVASLLTFASGPIATLVTSFDVKASRYRNIEIYGSEATLSLPDPNMFGGPLMMRGILNDDWREVSLPTPNIPQQRGIGLADMLSAAAAGRPHRASGEQALHVLELMVASVQSSDEGRRIDLTTTCERPAPMNFSLPPNTFD
jgi:predicted dehydrogenase